MNVQASAQASAAAPWHSSKIVDEAVALALPGRRQTRRLSLVEGSDVATNLIARMLRLARLETSTPTNPPPDN